MFLLGSAINFAATPLLLELGSEVAYPVGEGVVSGVMTFFWTLIGIIYLCMFFFKNIGNTWMNYTMVTAVVISIPFVALIKDIDRNKVFENLIGSNKEGKGVTVGNIFNKI